MKYFILAFLLIELSSCGGVLPDSSTLNTSNQLGSQTGVLEIQPPENTNTSASF